MLRERNLDDLSVSLSRLSNLIRVCGIAAYHNYKTDDSITDPDVVNAAFDGLAEYVDFLEEQADNLVTEQLKKANQDDKTA